MANRERNESRAKKKPGPARTYEHRFPIRAKADEVQRLKAKAKVSGLSLSRYLVECGLASSGQPDPEGRERQERAIFHLRKTLTSINQLVGTIKAHPSRLSASKVLEKVEAVSAAVREIADAFNKG